MKRDVPPQTKFFLVSWDFFFKKNWQNLGWAWDGKGGSVEGNKLTKTIRTNVKSKALKVFKKCVGLH